MKVKWAIFYFDPEAQSIKTDYLIADDKKVPDADNCDGCEYPDVTRVFNHFYPNCEMEMCVEYIEPTFKQWEEEK